MTRNRTKNVAAFVSGVFLLLSLAVWAGAGGSVKPGGRSTCTPASGVVGGCLTAAAQEIGGVKTFVADGGIQARTFNATTSAFYGVAFADAGIQTSDGGGLGMTRVAAYNCSGVVNGVPCMANPYGIVEIYGSLPIAETTPFVCAVELYQYNDLGASADTCVVGLGVGATSTKIVRFTGDGSLHLTGSLYLDDARFIRGPPSTAVEVVATPSSNGVAMYLSVAGGGLASGGTVLGFYNPGVSGTNVNAIEHDGALAFLGVATGSLGTCNAGRKGRFQYDSTTGEMKSCTGTEWRALGFAPQQIRVTLSAGTATETVRSGARCVCTDETAENPVQCSVTGTTLTVNGEGSDVINGFCFS